MSRHETNLYRYEETQLSFQRVQELLTLNYSARKPRSERRYPFSLSGIIFCGSCGVKLAGKSAHGNGGRIPYYEHSWALKSQAYLVKKVFNCHPNRILAKEIEPAVWEQVESLLRNPAFAKDLILEAKNTHAKTTKSDEAKQIRERIGILNNQIEVLAERVAQLPKELPAAPFYKQMEKILQIKKQVEERLEIVMQDGES